MLREQDRGNRVGKTMGGFVFRRLDPEHDLPRLVALRNEIEATDRADRGTTEVELREDLAWPEGDPLYDRWVVEQPGSTHRLIADGATFKPAGTDRARVNVLVHPRWRGLGIGSELLRRAIERAREKHASMVGASVHREEAPGHSFLLHRGFRPDERFVFMRWEPAHALPEPVLPAGYTVRPYTEVGDPAILTAALNRGFIGHYQQRDATLEEMAHWLAGGNVRPDGIFLAFRADGDAAGVCATVINPQLAARRGEKVGYIDSLGVAPEHRRLGLGRALLLIGMRWLRDQGQGPIELDAWGHNELALPLYKDVGFTITRQGTNYCLNLDETGSPTLEPPA